MDCWALTPDPCLLTKVSLEGVPFKGCSLNVVQGCSMRGLFKGYAATLARYIPSAVLRFTIYEEFKHVFVLENENIRNTIIEMTSKRLGVAVVVDQDEMVKGIITDGDLRRMLQGQDEVEHLQAKDIMTKNPQTIDQDELAIKALEVMRSKSITQLIVADGKKYLGVIHLHDLLREGLV